MGLISTAYSLDIVLSQDAVANGETEPLLVDIFVFECLYGWWNYVDSVRRESDTAVRKGLKLKPLAVGP
jgi:hypothetical protein